MKASALLFLLIPAALHAQLSEPDTVFFGKILHHGGGEARLLTSGSLVWQITGPDGVILPVKATLAPLDGGNFSYSLRIPRHLAIAGLPAQSAPAGLPILADSTVKYRNAAITVDGHAARLADAAALELPAAGENRAEFVRADLIVDFPLPDSDSDGMPDWWEEKYGLDPLLASATADADGDGISNLAEFMAGTNPSLAATAPQLAGEWRVTIPENGSAALLMKALDADTPPALLTYTLNSFPPTATVRVLNGRVGGDRPVAVGGKFTQAEIDSGRVLISASAPLRGVSAGISLADENPSHASVTSALLLSTATRADLLAAGHFQNRALPDGLVLHDASASPLPVTLRAPSALPGDYLAEYVPTNGRDLPRLFLGSPRADIISGSGEADVIAPGSGNDILTGHDGADRFVFTVLGTDNQIVDFSPAQHDVIDVSALVVPAAGKTLTQYLQLTNGILSVDADGNGSGFTDATIRLPGGLPDLAELWDSGSIDAGTIVPRTAIFLTSADAAEENLAAGSLTIRRRGDATTPLTVSLQVTGTATAGTDYVGLPASITFAAGQKIVTLPISPLADDLREVTETVEISIAPAAGFDLATSSATVRLTDLPTRVWLEVAERVAYKDSLSPAQALLRRSGPLSSGLTVVLQTSGKATPAVDYRRPAASFVFAPGQDTLTVEIMPLATASLTNGSEDVSLTVKPDAAYQFGATPSARFVICDRPRTLADWRQARLPANTMNDEDFLAADLDGDGFNGLMEFALNLNPNGPDSAEKTTTKVIFDENGIPGFEFRRRPGAPEIATRGACSTDLKNWHPLDETNCEERSATIEADGLERVRQFLKSKPANGTIYFRLQVNHL